MKTFNFKVPVRRPKDWSYDYSCLSVGDTLIIVPEPSNVFDENALRIDDLSKQSVGYVPAELAEKITPKLTSNTWSVLGASVAEVNGSSATWVDVYVDIILQVKQ